MGEFFAALPEVAGAHVATILGLIFLDVMLGIAAAVRSGVFEWYRIATFYRTNVVPLVLGYVGLVGALAFVSLELLPPEVAEALPALAGWIGFGAIVASLFSSIKIGVEDLVSKTAV